MNKNRLFLIAMLTVNILLFLLRMTGMTVHIVLAVLGLAIMIPFTLKTKDEWTNSHMELLMRAMYLSELVTGIGLMRAQGVETLEMLHKVCAILFMVLLLILYIPKCKKRSL